jgi:hypothetical protein
MKHISFRYLDRGTKALAVDYGPVISHSWLVPDKRQIFWHVTLSLMKILVAKLAYPALAPRQQVVAMCSRHLPGTTAFHHRIPPP